jgi:uncharacterized damage-inducible protein DinB
LYTCSMDYDFLIDIYETERLKVLSVWNMFRDEDMERRPHASDMRGRSVREQMIHQCMSEDAWFRNMLGCDPGSPPLPSEEARFRFTEKYAADSQKRLEFLRRQTSEWWKEETSFFGVQRSRAWIVARRIAHTAHHRGQQTAMLRMLGRDVYSTYGPTADTGGLPKNGAPTIYAYSDEAALLAHGEPAVLPASVVQPVTERPAKI